MAQLIVCVILLFVFSHWDKPGKKKKQPNYTVFQAKENLRNMLK